MPDAQQLTPEALSTEYVQIVNRALREHRDDQPYKAILAAGEKLLDDTSIAVGLYEEDREHPHHWFTVRFAGGGLELVAQGKADADRSWTCKQAHLEEVVEHPQAFIDKPYRLDLDWMKKTLSVGD